MIPRPPMTIRSKVKVTGPQSVKALLLAAMILEQPSCSSVAVPFTPSCRIRLGDRMAGVSNAPLLSAPLVYSALNCLSFTKPK